MRNSIFALAAALGCAAAYANLEDGFRNPPHDAKPHTWWHWMNGNVTKEGITADLEAMAEIGLGGAQIFDAGCDIPAGPIAYNSPEWFDVVKHAAAEARRLGIELCLPNCSGWSSSGGPWNPPANGMKELDWTETKVAGPATFSAKLPQPPNNHGFYDDIAVLAIPTPAAEKDTMLKAGVDMSNPAPDCWKKGGNVATFTFAKPFAASGFSCRFGFGWTWSAAGDVAVEVSDDGKTFRPFVKRSIQLAASGGADKGLRFIAFPKTVSAKAFRLTFHMPSHLKVQVRDLELSRRAAIGDLAAKTFRVRTPVAPADVETTADQVVAKGASVDLTKKMAKDGTLTWEVPAGEWTIVRLGYAATGRCNHPASSHGRGPEVDKLSKSAMDFHFDAYVAKLCRHLGPLAGDVETGLNNILVDSYEVGSQNWTQGFEKEFEARTGYSLLPYLPVLTGRVVGSMDESERFLWDFRRVIADMFAQNYAGELAKKCHEYGLKLSLEPYGSCPSDNLQYGQDVDVPMGEFWSQAGTGQNGTGNARFASYLAHVWGRKFAAMESFTASPGGGSGRWQKTPFGLKAQGDRVYANGVNRIIYHRFTHQPWVGDKYLPGMTMGKWGMHLDRTQTWWRQGKEWISYQSRCQYMLQEGRPVVDGLFFCGENAPNDGGNTDGATGRPASLPYGYNWDICAREAFLKLKVEGGDVVAPGGVRYRMVVLDGTDTMSLPVLKKVGELVDAGAKVVGAIRPVKAPGLVGYPAADGQVKALAEKIWSKGVLTCSADEALVKLGVRPDFVWADKKGRDIARDDVAYIHRDYGAEGEAYFVAMPNKESTSIEVSFRATGRLPELWDAERGTIAPAPVWRVEGGRTHVQLAFRPSGSVFVVFRKPAPADHAVAVDVAARDVPEPKEAGVKHTLEILKAEYGFFVDPVPPNCKDVTSIFAENAGKGVRVVNDRLGGDPAPNVPKHLLAAYTLDGQAKRDYVSEHDVYTLPAGAQVDFVWYGELDADAKRPVGKTRDFTDRLAKLVKDGALSAKVDNELAGGDPAWMQVKTARVAYRLDGVEKKIVVNENATLTLPATAVASDPMPAYDLAVDAAGAAQVLAYRPLAATVRTAAGATRTVTAEVPAPVLVTGAWDLAFPPGWGAPAHTTFPRLASWTDNADPEIRYFSGTATYSRKLAIPVAFRATPGTRVILDLGAVMNFADVTVNGKTYPTLWKPPFRVDITDALTGDVDAALEVKVTNLWPNRLIGDDFKEEDCQWKPADFRQAIVGIPQWVKDGKKSPTGRYTFTTWKHWNKDDEPLVSGLLGPVVLRAGVLAK